MEPEMIPLNMYVEDLGLIWFMVFEFCGDIVILN